MKNIIIIGPVYPYKGGIAHYTSLLYKCLIKHYKVKLLSYKYLYPSLLYHHEQKDYSDDTLKIEKTYYLINTLNPFNWIKCGGWINDQNPDLVIIQWWHPYFTPCYLGILKRINRNIKIVFVCHNVFPHERFKFDKQLVKIVLKKGNNFIVHSKKDEADLKEIIPNAHCLTTVIPTFNIFRFHNPSKYDSKAYLGLTQDIKYILFFGLIRKYKGLDYLIEAMKYIKNNIKNVKLIIAGDFGENEGKYLDLININNVQDSIIIFNKYVPDKEVEYFFNASDVVAVPYLSATQSAVVQMAFGFNKPVIATKVGGLPDVIDDCMTGFLVEKENSKDLARAFLRFFSDPKCSIRMVENIRKESLRFSWNRLEENISEFIYGNSN